MRADQRHSKKAGYQKARTAGIGCPQYDRCPRYVGRPGRWLHTCRASCRTTSHLREHLESDPVDATSFLPAFGQSTATDPVTLAAVAYLGGFTNPNTRSAYMTDLRIYFDYLAGIGVHPFAAKRAHVQAFAVHLSSVRNNGASTVCRRVGTIKGFYETCVIDEYIEYSPALHLRLPKIQEDPSRRTWLTRWELAAVRHAAKESKHPADLALVTILGSLGMRVTAACNIRIEDITVDPSGYRSLRTVGKGSKISVKALPIPTWQAIDAAADGRERGPLLLRRDGSQMTRRSAAIVIARLCRTAGVKKHITPHSLRRSFATIARAAGVPLEVVQEALDHESSRTTRKYDRLGIDPHSQAQHTVAALLASAS